VTRAAEDGWARETAASSGSRPASAAAGAQWWVLFQEDLKGEGSPLGGFQRLHPTE